MSRPIDKISKRKQYRQDKFEGKRSTIDEYTGDRIFWGNPRDAIHKHPTDLTTDDDHITPLKVIEERYPKLTQEQRQEIANKDYNLALTNSKLNRSKGDLENHEYLLRQLKKGEPENIQTSVNMLSKEIVSRTAQRVEATKMMVDNCIDNTSEFISDQTKKLLSQDTVPINETGKAKIVTEKIRSEITLHSKFAAKTAKNMAGEFVSGATDTLVKSAIPLTAEAVRHLIKVSQGKESMSDAAKEVGKTTMDVAVAGGTNKLLVDAVTKQLLNSGNPVLCNIADSNGVAQIITVAAIVKESAVKYVNGEIDGKQFIEEVGEKGMNMTAGMIGGAVGKEIGKLIGVVAGGVLIPGPGGFVAGYFAGEAVGQALGTIITTVACSTIVSAYHVYKSLDDYKVKEKKMRVLEQEALKEMENQRNLFKSIIQRENQKWDEQVLAGFDKMLSCACEATFDIQGVTEGLDKIMALFGKTVRFKTIEEYEEQLQMPLTLRI